ncbi:MAG: phosphoribosylglycinamide formyltransferase, partial [Deltaproteobacteria bacterium]|nr:phosphoribosylglycinamide formyltransferase [Deltaproteobacteria bacterium]
MIKVAVLASGGGTNLQAIIDVIENRELTGITISMVLSDNEDSYALERAKKNNIPTEVIKKSEYTVREDYDKVLVERLNKYEIELVVLAGFMRLLSPVMTKAFPLRIINIHPSLLPSFPGLDVQRKAIEYGAKFSGATVHFVDNGVDTGPIILQGTVP